MTQENVITEVHTVRLPAQNFAAFGLNEAPQPQINPRNIEGFEGIAKKTNNIYITYSKKKNIETKSK